MLDTAVLVIAERGITPLEDLLEDDDDVAIAAVTAAELLVGVELASVNRHTARLAFVEDVLATIPIEDYDLGVARAHAQLLAHVRRTGKARGAHDLIIAATALATGRAVITADLSGFEQLPGVTVLDAR